MSPKVFVCHATEDKDRFVRNFGTRLLESGVDAWVDEWEIGPGDRLVRKIFDDGIKNARSFIIVISQISVEKPWVKEELDAAVVQRIERGTKIIPVILDDCKVPVVLQATRWVMIKDLNSYDGEMREIINSIFEHSDKPPLGSPPTYIQAAQVRFSDLSKIDSMVLKLIGESTIEKDNTAFLNTDDMARHAEAQDISYQQYRESLEVLDAKGYIELIGFVGDRGNNTPAFSLTYYGFERYAKAFISNYRSIRMEVIAQIVNHSQDGQEPIALSVNQPEILVRHILISLKRDKHFDTVDEGITGLLIYNVRPTLKRLLVLQSHLKGSS